MEPDSSSSRNWFDSWREFLQGELEGARSTASKLASLLITLLGTSLALVFALRRQENPFELYGTAIAINIWAIAVAAAAMYTWTQYLGSVKSTARRYVDPGRVVLQDAVHEDLLDIDFQEVLVRDPGLLAEIARTENREDTFLLGMGHADARKRANRFRIEFRRAILASATAFLAALLHVMMFVPAWFPILLFAAAIITIVLAWVALRSLVSSIATGFQQNRLQRPSLWSRDQLYDLVQGLNPGSTSFWDSLVKAACDQALQIPAAKASQEHRTEYTGTTREYQMWALAALAAAWTFRNFGRKADEGHCNAHRILPELQPCTDTVPLHRSLQNKLTMSIRAVLT